MNVIGVRFKETGKIYYFDAEDQNFRYKQKVIVDTEDGEEFGEVVLYNVDIEKEKFDKKLNKVLRIANEEDIKTHFINELDAKKAKKICQDKADGYDLNMKIVDCGYNFDRSKLTFYFTSDKRVDFRDLVKDLASTFKSRIELRQIGVRDYAKLVKHYGSCGQECCCSRHLTDFAPLSIKYAKDQNISLDPSKISGVCGRLMCCLAFEEDNYLNLKKVMPKYGQSVETEDGQGVVVGSDYVRECCKVRIQNESDDQAIEKDYKICNLNKLK
ncbi:stage 0 sporulation family protein [Anaerococcus sp. mt242]|uniref:PSP1 domain-containing protein n=1 Tax=unclassified Anaerococcus TaxID=2614126 RepID=UPI001933A9DF|nr:stage 0 sporulation family protein [uncultured Anaerococcus sp.]MBM0045851.1 stage 0 sporulation family protein [Anaerococcus sp. mt242]